jgi:glutathione S-transferase
MCVLETRLRQVPYLGGEYGIADIKQFPNVNRWFDSIGNCDVVKRALQKVDEACK